MAAAQEELYAKDEFVSLDMDACLQALAGALAADGLLSHGSVSIAVHAKGIELSIEQAMPLGLAANEFMTNAARHAFPGGRSCAWGPVMD
jgi:two-component sensor histidine kinase